MERRVRLSFAWLVGRNDRNKNVGICGHLGFGEDTNRLELGRTYYETRILSQGMLLNSIHGSQFGDSTPKPSSESVGDLRVVAQLLPGQQHLRL